MQLVRNGPRGLPWLETLVAVAPPEGRAAHGPVTADAVPGLIDAGMLQGGSHALCHGLTEAIAYLARQERLTFARVGVIDPLDLSDYAAHGGWQGLERAARMEPAAIVQEVLDSGLRGRGGAASWASTWGWAEEKHSAKSAISPEQAMRIVNLLRAENAVQSVHFPQRRRSVAV